MHRNASPQNAMPQSAVAPITSLEKSAMQAEFFLASKSPLFRGTLHFCERVADSSVNILLIGESGTGKEVAARYIHACSSRAGQPFVAINCSSYTETLLESELFGYEQGAFTGAVKSRVGRFELADHGTLFADEVGDINMATQLKLLRAIETKSIERLGSNQQRKIQFRLISATNRDLQEEIAANRFREDFFYRISTIVIRIPPLRERQEDLEDMIRFFLALSQKENHRDITKIEPEVWNFLTAYHYPGNVRELRNIIDRMVVLSEDGIITKDGLPILFDMNKEGKKKPQSAGKFTEVLPWKDFKQQSEKQYLQWILQQTDGNISEAARVLEISSRQLFNKINEYSLRKPKSGGLS